MFDYILNTYYSQSKEEKDRNMEKIKNRMMDKS